MGRLMLFHKKTPESVWISGGLVHVKSPGEGIGREHNGKFKQDGKTAGWLCLAYRVCIRFLGEHIPQIAVGFFTLVLFFRKQAASTCIFRPYRDGESNFGGSYQIAEHG